MNDRSLLFLLDYDGTLTDFKRNPDHSRISPAIRSTLLNLSRKYPVIMVTGRYADSLYKVSGLRGFPVIGTHGFEARNLPKGLRFATARLERRYQKEAALLWGGLRELRTRFSGIHIERKPYSSTLHFRGLGYSKVRIQLLHKEFSILFRRTVTPRLWNLHKGKEMIEVVPKGYSKGRSVQKLLKHFTGHRAIYAGDDISDISVFKVLGKRGLKIAVGGRIPSKYYDLRFDSPKDFTGWLTRLSRI